jgi:hypothetical protein
VQLDRVALVGVLDRVLEQGIERRPQPVRVDEQLGGDERPEPPGAWRQLRPAHEHVVEERLELDAIYSQEVGLLGGGKGLWSSRQSFASRSASTSGCT